MHYVHVADLPINSIKSNQSFNDLSNLSDYKLKPDQKNVQNKIERINSKANLKFNQFHNHNYDLPYDQKQHKRSLNRRYDRNKKSRRKRTNLNEQSNKIRLKNENSDLLSSAKHPIFERPFETSLLDRVKSNYSDDDRSSTDLKKRTTKRSPLTNLFYQYTALMQSQLIPGLFMYNNSQLLPSISLSSVDSLTNNLTNSLSNSNSNDLSSNLFSSNLVDFNSLSTNRVHPKIAFLFSSNQSYDTSFKTFNSSFHQTSYNLSPDDRSNSSLTNSYQNTTFNTSTSDFTLWPSFDLLNLNSLLTILISVIMVICILVTAVGNLLVIVAILNDRVLRNVQNYLVLSLALADFMVALIVMPLSAFYEIKGQWTLGVLLCDVWTWADVLCCTASILHLLAIAIDRYWAVTSVEYMRTRSANKILALIGTTWFVALLVSVGPLLGWKDSNFEKRLNEEGVCSYSQELSYQLFATISTFYAPLVFILLLYYKIFQVARKRLRNKPGNNQLLKSSQAKSASTKTVKNNSLTQPEIRQNSDSLANEDSTSSCSRTNSKYCNKSIANDQTTQQDQLPNSNYQDTNNNNPLIQSTTDLSSSVNSPATTIIELQSSTNTPIHLLDTTPQNTIAKQNGLQATLQNGSVQNDEIKNCCKQANCVHQQQNYSTELLPMKQLSSGKAFSVVVADNNERTTTLILADESSTQFNVDEQLVVTCNGSNENTENPSGEIHKSSIKKSSTKSKQMNQTNMSKEMAARLKQKQQQDSKRERKTARILAIITGVFVICWLPFFVLTLLKALVPKYGDYNLLFSIFLWLGYINSLINPIIYTIFSPDFRSAFKKLLKGRRQN